MKELPEGWEVRKISDLAEFIRGVTYKKEQAVTEPKPGYVALLRATNIDGDSLLLDRELLFVPNEVAKFGQHLQAGDIVIATSSGSSSVVGKSALLKSTFTGTFGAFCGVLRPSYLVAPLYLSHYLQSRPVRTQWSEAARGTNINNLKRPDVEDTLIRLPALPEQQRIVEVIEEQFSRLDAGVESLRRAKRNLVRLRDALLDDSVVDASRLGSMVRVDHIAQVQLGRQRSPKHHKGTHMRPYLRAANVTWDGVSVDDVKEMNFSPEDFGRFRLAAGDLLLNEASGSPNEVGKPAIWDGSIPDACFQNTLLRVRPTDSIDRRFLHMVFYAAATNGGFAKVARGVNIMHLGKAGLAAWRVPVPPLEDQHRIVAEVDRQFSIIDAMAKTIDSGLQRASTLRQSILSQAFSGKLTGAA